MFLEVLIQKAFERCERERGDINIIMELNISQANTPPPQHTHTHARTVAHTNSVSK